MSWTTAATTAGLLLSFLVILAAREISGDAFDVWGWRLPFIGSIVMLMISLAMRLRMEESPAFKKLRLNKQLSKSPIRDTFLDAANFRRIAVAFALEPGPWPCRVNAAEVSALLEFAGKLKVMEDAEDGLDDLHELMNSAPPLQ